MTTIARPIPAIWSRFKVTWNRDAPSSRHPSLSNNSHAEARSRQDFVLEMLRRNANAFQSELDVQSMMYSYPCRF